MMSPVSTRSSMEPLPCRSSCSSEDSRSGAKVFVQVYGMTETAAYLTALRQWDHIVDGTPEQERRLSSCGKQILGVEVRVINARGEDVQPGEIGEIIARGPNVMLGYWRQPELSAEALRDGWFTPGIWRPLTRSTTFTSLIESRT